MISCDMSTDSLGFQIVKDVLIDLSENTSNIRSTSRKNLRGELSDDKMRSGGPKLLCSPYFSIGSVVVLLILVAKYYSLSSEHDNLLLKVSVLQNQMKLT